MAIEYRDECCSCATESYPCLGSSCPNRNVSVLICDKCKEECEELYHYGDEEWCADCILTDCGKVTID